GAPEGARARAGGWWRASWGTTSRGRGCLRRGKAGRRLRRPAGPTASRSDPCPASGTVTPRSASTWTPRGPIRSPQALSLGNAALSARATRAPPRASTRAATLPAGPAPTTTASYLNCLPPSRDVVPEARQQAGRWLREARGSGGLPPGPAESRRREAAARSVAAFGPAPAAQSSPGQHQRHRDRAGGADEIAQRPLDRREQVRAAELGLAPVGEREPHRGLAHPAAQHPGGRAQRALAQRQE